MTLVGDIGNAGGCACVGAGGILKFLFQFCCKLKIIKKVFFKSCMNNLRALKHITL